MIVKYTRWDYWYSKCFFRSFYQLEHQKTGFKYSKIGSAYLC